MPSFDVMLEPNLVEVRNAIDQTRKEIGTRFDFKGTSAQVEWSEASAKERAITLTADSDFQIGQVRDVLLGKMSKRGVDVRFLVLDGALERIGGDRVRQAVAVQSGIGAELGKRIQGLVKQSKLKLQAALQGDVVRVSGTKRDELQAAIALLRKEVADAALSFGNFRD
jgi:uncharacterized protein YajQ (UPF0234 family)